MYVSNLPIAIGHVFGSVNKSNNTHKFMCVTTITVHTLCGYRIPIHRTRPDIVCFTDICLDVDWIYEQVKLLMYYGIDRAQSTQMTEH